ncbi:proteic killer suppression protein [Microbacteriaceae bacterium SG_E_30_P1]|uniref:Proteic killer suppression protein n=1 Tax=Antiquaquibacter oligotrophicus TaxID=2880260 RepID=A0ABT6KMX0_9MICO|nr:type II toxin-antitoxin system RelE/ParE family toxin [Antiquaquibacter oligotrophicus]MDH6181355.1 proteic killer suppression protein [Antiquaquibacter oligotrophicus]UDF12952.1 type II toxin-antitoxin system RelE/ParE family toxin [Antiquaquibacter oligotrophicus]
MIKSFRHKGLQKFFETGSKAGIRPDHALRLQRQLAVLDNAVSLDDLPSSWKPHPLTGVGPSGSDLVGHHAIWVSGNWRVTFYFEGTDVHLLDYLDYH